MWNPSETSIWIRAASRGSTEGLHPGSYPLARPTSTARGGKGTSPSPSPSPPSSPRRIGITKAGSRAITSMAASSYAQQPRDDVGAPPLEEGGAADHQRAVVD